MSGPTYRITTEYLPETSPVFPWQARVARLSDGQYMTTKAGTNEQEAVVAACHWIECQNVPAHAGGVYEADDEGNLTTLRPSRTWSDTPA